MRRQMLLPVFALTAAVLLSSLPAAAQPPGVPPVAGGQRTPPRAMRPGDEAPRGTSGTARLCPGRGHRGATPAGAGSRVGAGGAGHADDDHRRTGTLRVQGTGRRPLYRHRFQGRIRHPAVRPAPAGRTRHAGGFAGRPDAREAGLDARRLERAVGEQFDHPPGAGADVDQPAERARGRARRSIARSTSLSATWSERIWSHTSAWAAK